MQARLIAYPPEAPAVSRWLQPGERLRIGRDPACDLVIPHSSVSRAHAELYHDGDAWRLRDLGSKNGSFAEGLPITDHPLPAQCWLRLGDTYCDFGQFEDAHAAVVRERQAERRALSQALTRRMTQHGGEGNASLPAQVLQGVLELSGCERGFLLLADPRVGDFTVRASLHLDPSTGNPRAFSGSVGAVQRVLATGRALVVNDVRSEAWLSGRASVIAGGLVSLVCLPLSDGAQVFGAVYADRRGAPGEPGEPITDVDLELLGAFVESATLFLLAQRAMQSLDQAPRWQTIVSRVPLGSEIAP